MEKETHEPEIQKKADPAEGKHAHKAVHAHDEEHAHGNYMFAVKVLAILAAIILIIVILKASGVPIAIKDWLAAVSDCVFGAGAAPLF